ncbi:hypothetical protein DFH09DRAFT_1067940 [Mycena vulgaris]|nr:hypothetical protein DFH09DRAFT_1067940 [Mycena vulgaris]
MVKKNKAPASPLHRSPRKHKNKRQTVKAVKDAEPAPPPGADGGKLIWLLIRQLEDEQNQLVLFGKQSKDEVHRSTVLDFCLADTYLQNTSVQSKISVFQKIGSVVLPEQHD